MVPRVIRSNVLWCAADCHACRLSRRRRMIVTSWLALSFYLFGALAPAPRAVDGMARQVVLDETFEGARIFDIVTSSGLPNVIVVILINDRGGLMPRYSLDAGRTWQTLATPPGVEPGSNLPIYEIAIAPRADQSIRFLVLARTEEQATLYRSGDFGATWTTSISAYGISNLVASQADPQRLYLGTSTEPINQAFLGSLYTSPDGGISWNEISLGTDILMRAVPSPSIAGRVYRQIYFPGTSWSQSDDAGQTWTYPPFPSIGNVIIDAHNPLHLYGRSEEFYHSSDGGETWEVLTTVPEDNGQLLAHPTQAGVLFLLTLNGLYRSADSGNTWEKLSPIGEGQIYADYSTPGRLLWARGNCLWASTSAGVTWTPLTAGCIRVYLPAIIR
jgi:photosystem II stability/assembly factor-like uncharacterized protein